MRLACHQYSLSPGDDLDTFDIMMDECTDFDDVLTGTSYAIQSPFFALGGVGISGFIVSLSVLSVSFPKRYRSWATAKSVVEERLKPKEIYCPLLHLRHSMSSLQCAHACLPDS